MQSRGQETQPPETFFLRANYEWHSRAMDSAPFLSSFFALTLLSVLRFPADFLRSLSYRQRFRHDFFDVPLVQAQHAMTPAREGKVVSSNKRGELIVAM